MSNLIGKVIAAEVDALIQARLQLGLIHPKNVDAVREEMIWDLNKPSQTALVKSLSYMYSALGTEKFAAIRKQHYLKSGQAAIDQGAEQALAHHAEASRRNAAIKRRERYARILARRGRFFPCASHSL